MDEVNQTNGEGNAMNIFSILRNLDEYLARRSKVESELYQAMIGSLDLANSHMARLGSPWQSNLSLIPDHIQPQEMMPDLSSMMQISGVGMAGMGLDYHYDATGANTGYDQQVGDINYHHDATGANTGHDQQVGDINYHYDATGANTGHDQHQG